MISITRAKIRVTFGTKWLPGRSSLGLKVWETRSSCRTTSVCPQEFSRASHFQQKQLEYINLMT